MKECVKKVGSVGKMAEQPQLAPPITTTATIAATESCSEVWSDGRDTSGERRWPLLKCKTNAWPFQRF